MTTAEWMTTANQLGPAAASWLLTYAVHSTLLVGGVALVTRVAVQSYTLRDILWKTALLGGVFTATLQVGFGVAPLTGTRIIASTGDAATGRSALGPSTFVPHVPAATTPPVDAARKPVAPAEAEPSSVPSVTEPSVTARVASVTWTGVLFIVWLAASALLLFYFFLVRIRLVLRLGRRVPVVDGPMPRSLDALRREAGMWRPVRLTTAAGLTSPVALGLSEICVPEEVLTELDPAQQQSMLAHELAHLARFDPLWLTVSCLLEQLLFFQPLNRLARRRMQDAAEYLCDDWAVRRTGSGMTLAKCLVKVAEWVDTSPRTVPVSGMAEQRSQLVARIHRLLENRAMITQPRVRWLLPLAVVVLAVTAIVAPGFTAGQPTELAAQDPTIPPATPRPPASVSALAQTTAERSAVAAAHSAAAVARAIAVGNSWSGIRPFPTPRIAMWGNDRVPDTTNVAVPPLISALSDPDANVRIAAANSLGQLGDPRAIPALVTASRDANPKVRAAAFDALTSFDDPRIFEPMVSALKDPDAEVRERAAQVLGSLQNKQALQPLIAALADSSAGVREAAVRSLGELQDPAATSALAGALKDSRPAVRQAAAESLGELGLTKAPPALIAALRDPVAEVRESAARSLGEMQDPSAVPGLQACLNDSNADVRETAVQALGEIGDSASVNALIAALKSNDASVRRQAAQALGQRQ